jgi:hypothetical protein
MNINEKNFPILGCLQGNILTNEIIHFVNRQVPDQDEQKEIVESANFFYSRTLKINHISESLHKQLLLTSNFIHLRKLLKNSQTGAGLLLLPEILYPDFTNVPEYVDIDCEDYPIDAILYSWLSTNDHDKLMGDFDEQDPWDKDEDRQLFILPIYQDGTTQATKHYEMTSNDDIYGWEYSNAEGRAWYGKIHDYVMSFLIYYNINNKYVKDAFEKLDENLVLSFDSQTFLNKDSNLIEIINYQAI